MASYTTVRNGLKTALESITSPAWSVFARTPGDVPVPCALVVPAEPAIVFDDTFGRGADTLNFRVIVLVGVADDEVAQTNLDAYLAGSGAQSVKAALEAAGGISGVSYVIVPAVSSYGDVTYAGQTYLGAEFEVVVCAGG